MRKGNRKRLVATILSLTMLLSLCGVAIPLVTVAKAATMLSNPTMDSDGVTTWDCVYFGNYWQNDTNGDGKANQSDEKTPIKWRVLSVNGDDAFLLADQGLDCKSYNNNYKMVEAPNVITLSKQSINSTSINKLSKMKKSFSCTWETSSLRQWLNEEFYNNTFSSSEKRAIIGTNIKNEKNAVSGVDGGNDTFDNIYILSLNEIKNESYGLSSEKNRRTSATLFAKTNGVQRAKSLDISSWWLRTPGFSQWQAIIVRAYGGLLEECGIQFAGYNAYIDDYYAYEDSYIGVSVRPVLHIKLSSNAWRYAGTVNSDGEESSEKIIVNKKNDTLVTGTYKDGQLKKVFSDTESYSDSYFTNSSTKVQGGLAKLSMLAASSAYNKEYAEKLMESCEFSIHDYKKKKPTKKKNDTISYEIGIRKVNDITIIAVWIKGTSGDYEWVSNWNLGKKDMHIGFSKAEKAMDSEINSYLKSKKINLTNSGKVKMWITGHSRGAAIANLYAKRMNDIVGSSNVYAYTFATPRVSKLGKQNGYKNIFNYLNPGDFVTEVPPKKWGYKRYGKDIILSMSKKNKMEKMFKKICGKKYNGFDKKGKKSLLKAFISYAGSSNKDYYRKKSGYSPSYFCKNGLGNILAGNTKKGLSNCLKVCNVNGKATVVLGKMFIDGKVNNKFGYAHTQLGYLSWLKQMY